MWPQSGRHIEGASCRHHKTRVWPLTHCRSRCWFHGGRETREAPTPFEALQETNYNNSTPTSSRINTGLYECGHPSRYYIYNHVQPRLTWSLVVKDNTLTAHAIRIFTNIFNWCSPTLFTLGRQNGAWLFWVSKIILGVATILSVVSGNQFTGKYLSIMNILI